MGSRQTMGALFVLSLQNLQVQGHSLGVLLSQRVFDVTTCLCERMIGAPESHHEQAAEHIKGTVVAIRNNLLFRLLLIKPVRPLLLVTGNLGEQKCRISICNTQHWYFCFKTLMTVLQSSGRTLLGMSQVEISVTEYSTTENRFDHEYSMLTNLPSNFLELSSATVVFLVKYNYLRTINCPCTCKTLES